jgi:hypothetical protein
MTNVPDEEEEGLLDVRPDDPEEQEAYLRRLRGRYPNETAGMSSSHLMETVREALGRCPPLLIRKPRDVLRFLALVVIIAPKQNESKFLRAVNRRVLYAVEDWTATKRLDFIYKHVVGRPAPDPEPDFGPWFAEAPPPPA